MSKLGEMFTFTSSLFPLSSSCHPTFSTVNIIPSNYVYYPLNIINWIYKLSFDTIGNVEQFENVLCA